MHRNWHRSRNISGVIILTLALAFLTRCHSKELQSSEINALEPVAFSDFQWTGLAVSKDGRLFVNYPRWSDNVPLSIAEIINGNPIPYPNKAMNDWQPGKKSRHTSGLHTSIVC